MKTYLIALGFCIAAGTLLAQAPAKPAPKPTTKPPVGTATKPVAGKATAAPTDSTKEDENALPQIEADKPLVLGAVNMDDPEYILVPYDLPYSGMVEIRLISPEGKQVYRDQFVQAVGPNIIRLKRTGFKKPGLYTFMLNFKTKDYKGGITI